MRCTVGLRPAGYYVGIARAVRKQQRHGTGICCRWLEHLTALIRSQCPESGRLRYCTHETGAT